MRQRKKKIDDKKNTFWGVRAGIISHIDDVWFIHANYRHEVWQHTCEGYGKKWKRVNIKKYKVQV